MICHDLKSLNNLNKAETVEYSASVIQSSSLSVLSFNKLFFSKTDLTTAE